MKIELLRDDRVSRAFINAKTYIIMHHCNLYSKYPQDIVNKFQTILNINIITNDNGYPYQGIEFISEEDYFLFLLKISG